MPTYGPWLPGPEHSIRISWRGKLFEWLSPAPHPTLVPVSFPGHGYRRSKTFSDLPGTELYNNAGASECAWHHARVGSSPSVQLWGGTCPMVPAPGAPGTGSAPDFGTVSYSYTGTDGIAADEIGWSVRGSSVELEYNFADSSVGIPESDWPDGAVGYEMRGTYDEWEAAGFADPPPVTFTGFTLYSILSDALSGAAAGTQAVAHIRRFNPAEAGNEVWPDSTLRVATPSVGGTRFENTDPPLALPHAVLQESLRVPDTSLQMLFQPKPVADGMWPGTTGVGATTWGIGNVQPETVLSWLGAPYRWIYADVVPEVPPQRVFPRDDGRLTASASRVWPPPKSRQGSARLGPGSYL